MEAKESNASPYLKCVALGLRQQWGQGQPALRWSIQEGNLQKYLNEILWRAPLRTLVRVYLDGIAAWRSTIICIICSIMAIRRSILACMLIMPPMPEFPEAAGMAGLACDPCCIIPMPMPPELPAPIMAMPDCMSFMCSSISADRSAGVLAACIFLCISCIAFI